MYLFSFKGCRSAGVNLEARSLMGWSTSRHCVIARIQDLTIDHFRNIRSKAGALVIVLPEDLSQLSPDEKQVSITALHVCGLHTIRRKDMYENSL